MLRASESTLRRAFPDKFVRNDPRTAWTDATRVPREAFVYVISVRVVEQVAHVLLYDASTRAKYVVTVSPIWYPLVLPDTAEARAMVAPAVRTEDRVAELRCFNADLKRSGRCLVALFDSANQRERFARRYVIDNPDEPFVGLFGKDKRFDPRTAAVVCGLLPCRYYALREGVAQTAQLSSFMYNEEASDKMFMESFDELCRAAYREGALDLETVVYQENLCEDVRAHAEHDLQRADTEAFDAAIAQSCLHPNVLPAHGCHQFPGTRQITSAALVYKAPGVKPKRRLVYYVAPDAPPPMPPGADEPCVEFVRCGTEAELLERLFAAIEQHVDVLYVYNFDFDVWVLHGRVRYYLSRDPATGVRLRARMNAAFSYTPEKFQPVFRFKIERLRAQYRELVLNKVAQHVDALVEGLAPGEKVTTQHINASPAKKALLVDVLRGYFREYSHARDRAQESDLNGLGVYVLDLHKYFNVKSVRDATRTRGLNAVAKHVIGRDFPRKPPAKWCKLQDMPYHLMDGEFARGGDSLSAYLMYNLRDSELLMRMARKSKPYADFVHRVRASWNTDFVSHGRAIGMFSGSFVQTMAVVEMPLLMSRLVSGTVFSWNVRYAREPFEEAYWPENRKDVPLKGGEVLEPVRCLNYAVDVGAGAGITTVDYNSLYPSNMCDANISPDALVSTSKVKELARCSLVLLWRGITEGEHNLATILATKRDGAWRPFNTYTTSSLRHYLSNRTHFKRLMKTDPGNADYYNRMQTEMKLCANSHYGVADRLCQTLTTAMGRRKLGVAWRTIVEQRGVPVYGDTDSVMFAPACPPLVGAPNKPRKRKRAGGGDEAGDDEATCPHERLAARLRASVRSTKACVLAINEAVFDYVAERVRYVDARGTFHAMSKELRDDGAGGTEYAWQFDDGSGAKVRLADVLHPHISNIEYENTASITLNMLKKMYVYLVHELSPDGRLGPGKLKQMGVMAKKGNSAGAVVELANDVSDAVFYGHAVAGTARRGLRSLERCVESRPWSRLEPGDAVLHATSASTSRWCTVRAVSEVRAELPWHRAASLVRVEFADEDDVPAYECAVERDTLVNVTHLYDAREVGRRTGVLLERVVFRHFVVGAGLFSWTSLVAEETVSDEGVRDRLMRAGAIGSMKANKGTCVRIQLASSKLVRSSTTAAQAKTMIMQAPYDVFFQKMPFNRRLDVLARDCWGGVDAATVASAPKALTELHPYVARRNAAPDSLPGLKDRVDRTLLGENAKYVSHAIVAAVFNEGRGTLPDEGEALEAARAALVEAMQRCESALRQGTRWFDAHFNTLPYAQPCMYRFARVRLSLPPAVNALRLTPADLERVKRSVAEAVAEIERRAEQSVRDNPDGRVVFGASTVAEPFAGVVVRACPNEPANHELVALARSIYDTQILLAVIESAEPGWKVPRETRANGAGDKRAAGPPPWRTTRADFERFCGELTAAFDGSYHCSGCAEFWKRANALGSADAVLARWYAPDAADERWCRRARRVCIDESSDEGE